MCLEKFPLSPNEVNQMKTILIVDDRAEVRQLLEITLSIGNNRIIFAENGDMAIKMAKKDKPELIIMDIVMPGEIDGIEATRLIRNDPETSKCRILILTR